VSILIAVSIGELCWPQYCYRPSVRLPACTSVRLSHWCCITRDLALVFSRQIWKGIFREFTSSDFEIERVWKSCDFAFIKTRLYLRLSQESNFRHLNLQNRNPVLDESTQFCNLSLRQYATASIHVTHSKCWQFWFSVKRHQNLVNCALILNSRRA